MVPENHLSSALRVVLLTLVEPSPALLEERNDTNHGQCGEDNPTNDVHLAPSLLEGWPTREFASFAT